MKGALRANRTGKAMPCRRRKVSPIWTHNFCSRANRGIYSATEDEQGGRSESSPATCYGAATRKRALKARKIRGGRSTAVFNRACAIETFCEDPAAKRRGRV